MSDANEVLKTIAREYDLFYSADMERIYVNGWQIFADGNSNMITFWPYPNDPGAEKIVTAVRQVQPQIVGISYLPVITCPNDPDAFRAVMGVFLSAIRSG